MKRTALFLGLALAIVFAAALLNVNRASGDDHGIHKHHQQAQSEQQQKQPVVDGAAVPGAIPDHAAQEVVLRLLASDEPDRLGDRKRAYLRAYGFDENAQAALMLAAREYKRLVEPIEREADDIKDHNWPNPGSTARARLNQLQRDKEEVIAGVASELNGRLQTYRSFDKWTHHFSNTVKRKIKGFASELPTRKIGFFRLLPDPFAAYAQAGGCDPTYVYTDAVYDDYSLLIYGYSSYSAGANNCGHDFYPSTQITHTGAPTAYGTDYAVFNLDAGSYYYDGSFFVYTGVEGFCPVAQVTFPAGNNSDSEVVNATVAVTRLTASDDDVAHDGMTTLIAEIKATGTVAGTVTVGFGITSNPGQISFSPEVSTQTCTKILSSSVHEGSCMITVDAVNTNPIKKGPVIFHAGINSLPTGAVAGGGPQTVNVCFGPKVGGSCNVQ